MNHDKDNDDLWEAIHRLEVSGKNTQDFIKKLFLHSTQHEIAIKALDKKVDAHQQENRERFDRLEKEQIETRKAIGSLENEQIETRKDIASLELLIRQLLPNATN